MRPYAHLRGKCGLCGRTFDLEHRIEEEDVRVDLNRGDCAMLPNPAGWYMPPHRFATSGEWAGHIPCPTSFRLVPPGH